MKKRLLLPVLTVAMFGLMTVSATSAMAHATKTSLCSDCHNPAAAVHVSATLVSNDGANAVYAIAVDNPYGSNGWAVFNGASKVGGAAGSGANVSVPVGSSYTVFGVSAPNGGNGYASLTISPTGTSTPGTVTGTVTSPVVASHSVTVKIKVGKRGNKGLTAVLTDTTTGAKYFAKVGKKGKATFTNVPDGTYRLTVKVKGKKFKFKPRIVVVGAED